MKGTTPTILYTLPIELNDVKNFSVTFSQGGEPIITKMKSDCEITDGKIIVRLSQEDTLKLQANKIVETQIKFLFSDGNVVPTKIKQLYAKRILDEQVIT